MDPRDIIGAKHGGIRLSRRATANDSVAAESPALPPKPPETTMGILRSRPRPDIWSRDTVTEIE